MGIRKLNSARCYCLVLALCGLLATIIIIIYDRSASISFDDSGKAVNVTHVSFVLGSLVSLEKPIN